MAPESNEGTAPAGAGDQAEDAVQISSFTTRYEMGPKLASGAMGMVVEARDLSLGRTVAIKKLWPYHADQPDVRIRFMNEAGIMASLDHPGCVPVYEAGMFANGECFYSMKKLTGRTLHNLMAGQARRRAPSREKTLQLLDIFERVCETMAYAHSKRIVHRDLKPENIMVDDFGVIYVVDWGLAKHLPAGDALAVDSVDNLRRDERSDAPVGTTAEGAAIGTPVYMSPEQASGRGKYADYRSDVFSLGIILYEILCGQLPFAGSSFSEVSDEVIHRTPVEPRRVWRHADRELTAICMKALNKHPAQRYPTAKELADDLRAHRERRPVGAAPPKALDRLVRIILRRCSPAGVLICLGVLLLVMGLIAGLMLGAMVWR